MSAHPCWTDTVHSEDPAVLPHDVPRAGRFCARLVGFSILAWCLGAGAGLAQADENAYDRGNPHGNQLIVRAAADEIDRLASQYPLVVVGEMRQAEGDMFLVEGSSSTITAEQLEDMMLGDPGITSVVRAELASLPAGNEEMLAIDSYTEDIAEDRQRVGEFSSPCMDANFSVPLWNGYADQRAVRKVRVHEAHLAGGCGESAVVAVLDTGVDSEHPLLAGAVIDGYDFLQEKYGLASDAYSTQSVKPILGDDQISDLDQSVKPILGGLSEVLVLDASVALLDTEGALDLSGIDIPPYYGHGTMVAGLIRVSAPAAKILPLRVFNPAGSAHIFDVIRAIYFAVDHGATVINMSFSMKSFSPELMRAIHYARMQGVVCVAAAGNEAERTLIYPASFGDTVGVASVTVADTLSAFSNRGSEVAAVAAPGDGILSVFPGGRFAAGWGTSFSTPLVSGAMALLQVRFPDRDTAAFHQKMNALIQGSEDIQELSGLIGSGRLDAFGMVEAPGN